MKSNRNFITVVCCLIGLAIPLTGFAEEKAKEEQNFQLDPFDPLPAQGVNILNTATSDMITPWMPAAGVFVHYLNQPLTTSSKTNGQVTKSSTLIKHQVKVEPSLAIGLGGYADLGVIVPIVAWQDGTKNLAPDQVDDNKLSSFSVGDLRAFAKVALINPNWDWTYGFGLSLGVTGYFPIPIGKGKDATYHYTSYYNPDSADKEKGDYLHAMRVEPRLIIDWRHKSTGITVATNIGWQYRPERVLKNFATTHALRWNVGAKVPMPGSVNWLAIIGTIYGEMPFVGEDLKKIAEHVNNKYELNNSPIEFEAGLQFKMPYDLYAQVGAGTAVGTRFTGTPKYRIFGSIGYTPFGEVTDTDQDGVADPSDECPEVPGDPENAGCPWGDLDEDSVLDNVDECPDEAGEVENNGCPWGDRDGDGVLDNVDNCPDEAGPAENAGCPWGDRDNDGIVDQEDKCIDEPEDKDGFEDNDGCPDLDNDNDGIPDAKDQCPNKPETYNGVDDEDGCPDKGKTKVRVTNTKIEILEKVFFATGKSRIRDRSFNLLDQVASVLKNYDRITKVRIEGHTDSVGSDRKNLKLSQDRADAVREYLMDRGVNGDRLEAVGYGEDRPIDSNRTRRGRERNRRVEFTITELNGKPVSTNSVTIKEKEIIN